MKKQLLNSDVVNDNENIYVSEQGNMFEMICFPINGNIVNCITSAIKELEATGRKIGVMLIPFTPYNNFICQKDKIFPGFEMDSLDEIIYLLAGSKIQIMITIPDALKDKCKPTA